MKIGGFFQRHQQLDLIQPYFEKYYDVVAEIVEKRDRELAEVFMNGLCPSFMAREDDEARLKQLLESANPDKNFFILFLKEQLEAINLIRRSRDLCSHATTD